MALTLHQSQLLDGIAEVLYDFLPWSGSRGWRGHINFKTVAIELNLGAFYNPNLSKQPGIRNLLELTYRKRPGDFESLILSIVKEGFTYRGRQSNPIRRDEIERLNGLLIEFGMRFPDLNDAAFLRTLDQGNEGVAARRVAEERERAQRASAETRRRHQQFAKLRDEFMRLHVEPNRQRAGRMLEKLLNQLFTLSGLEPRQAYRTDGEEIDGSFLLDGEVYLLEAKWEKKPLSHQPLSVFGTKIERTSSITRGVLLSINDVTDECRVTMRRSPARFFVMTGHDLMQVLQENIELTTFLRKRVRILAEEGRMFVPLNELIEHRAGAGQSALSQE